MAADLYAALEEEDSAAWAAYCGAEKEEQGYQGGEDRGKTGGGKQKDGKRAMNFPNRKKGAL